MGPVALLVFKTSEPANNGLVGSTPTRLRHPSQFSTTSKREMERNREGEGRGAHTPQKMTGSPDRR